MKEDVRFPPRLSRAKHPCGKSQTQAGSSGGSAAPKRNIPNKRKEGDNLAKKEVTAKPKKGKKKTTK